MSKAQNLITQYLTEARASEHALTRVLQSQIAMTPEGDYRSLLETHLAETREHATRVAERLKRLPTGFNPVGAAVGLWEDALGQTLALSKAPLDLVRGGSGEEKVLKNAKDTCATEALEIATYAALQRIAEAVGDEETARLAADIRGEEETMLTRVMDALPGLADAVVASEVHGDPRYDVTRTGAADAVRETARAARREAREVSGVTEAEGAAKGATASEDDLPIAHYDGLTAEQINGRLPSLSQLDLVTVETYERAHDARTTVLDRIESLRGEEPWTGYDAQNVDAVRERLANADEDERRTVRDYERSHKDRSGVLRATERVTAAR